jgi:hypothetical protein
MRWMYEGSRESNSSCSCARCVVNDGVLFAVRLSCLSWAGRSKRQLAGSATLATRRCFRSTGCRICAGVPRPESMQDAQPVQHRAVLGRCCNSSSDYSFPASHRELGSRLSDCMWVHMRYVALFVVATLACLVFWYFWGSQPNSQPPLTSLTPSNLDQFKREFNGAADRNRLVLLLSPT